MSKFNEILSSVQNSSYSFRINLLSNRNIEIEFRPMIVKDQKALLVNTEKESLINQLKGMVQLAKSCIKKSSIPIEELYIMDFMWLIINIRMKSIGEDLNLTGKCKFCKKTNDNLTLNLEKDINIVYLDKIKNNVVNISENLKLILNLPKIKHLISKKEDSNAAISILVDEIESVEYKGEIIDLTNKEKEELLENLSVDIVEEFKNFEKSNEFGITLVKEFDCGHCKEHNKVEVKDDLISFF